MLLGFSFVVKFKTERMENLMYGARKSQTGRYLLFFERKKENCKILLIPTVII